MMMYLVVVGKLTLSAVECGRPDVARHDPVDTSMKST